MNFEQYNTELLNLLVNDTQACLDNPHHSRGKGTQLSKDFCKIIDGQYFEHPVPCVSHSGQMSVDVVDHDDFFLLKMPQNSVAKNKGNYDNTMIAEAFRLKDANPLSSIYAVTFINEYTPVYKGSGENRVIAKYDNSGELYRSSHNIILIQKHLVNVHEVVIIGHNTPTNLIPKSITIIVR